VSAAPKSTEARTRQLWDEANALLGRRAVDQAVSKAEELLQLLREQSPAESSSRSDDDASAGDAQGLLALLEHLRGQPSRADQYYAGAFEFFRMAPAAQNALGHARLQVSFALTLAERGKKDDARHALVEAVEVLRPTTDRFEDAQFDLLRVLANRALQYEAADVAEAALKLGIDAWEKRHRPRTGLVGYWSSLISVHLAAERPEEARLAAEKSLELVREAGLGPEKIATALINLSKVMLSMQRFDEAFSRADQALACAASDAEIRYHVRDVQARALMCDHKPEEASKALDEAIGAAKEAFGQYANQTIELHARLATVLEELNRYAQALPHRSLLLAVAEARSGNRSLAYADALNDHALVLDQMGDYSQAQEEYERALELTRPLRGENHPDVLMLRFNLAELARATRDLETAEQELRALRTLQDKHADLVASSRLLVSLGLTLSSLEKYDEARAALDDALTQRAKLFGTDAPQYARVLLALGQLESGRQAYEAAKPFFESAVATFHGKPGWEGMLEAAQLGIASCRVRLEASNATFDDALALFERIATRRGPNHASVSVMGDALAVELSRVGAFSYAQAVLERCDSATRFELIETLQSKGAQDLRRIIEQMRLFQHLHLSLVLADSARSAASERVAYEMLIALRGAETMVLRLRGLRFVQSDPSDSLREVWALKRRIVQLQLTGGAVAGREHSDGDIERLRQALRKAEGRLIESVGEGRLDLEFLSPALKSLSLRLREDAAIVEFALYTRIVAGSEPPLSDSLQYAAFIVRGREDGVHLIDLGPAAPIDALIEQFRDKVIHQPLRAMQLNELQWREPAAVLAQRLFDPLRAALAGIKQVTVVSEGSIGLLPLGVLPGAGGKPLIEEFEIGYACSSRRLSLLNFEEDFGLGGVAAVFGAPDYGDVGDEGLPSFEALTETEGECTDIANLLQVEPHLGPAATERALKQYVSPEILHIATHGFYLPAAMAAAKPTGPHSFLPGRASLADPLERAGLAFAGANVYVNGGLPSEDGDDGILYASEVAGLQLTRTDLVTLSACQTGLGDVETGDGVHGLQRAFTTAGARSVVCSLWEVPDKASRMLFTKFYAEILKGRRRGEALRSAVRELVNEFPLHPIAWGGFVLYGDAGVLTRFEPVRTLNIETLTFHSGSSARQESPAQHAQRLVDEGRASFRNRDVGAAIEAFTAAAELPGAPDELRVRGVYERAGVRRMTGDLDGALRDYALLDTMLGVPERMRIAIEGDRGTTFTLARRYLDAIVSYTKVIEWAGLEVDTKAAVLFNRAMAHAQLGELETSISDFDSLIVMPGAPPLQRAKALLGRAEVNLLRDRPQETQTDAQEVLTALEVEPTEIASAHLLLARAFHMQGKPDEATRSLRAALAVTEIPERLSTVARQLLDDFA
jgi:CHAT domain-containing protein